MKLTSNPVKNGNEPKRRIDDESFNVLWPMVSIDVRLKSFVKLYKSIRRTRINKICRSSMIRARQEWR